MRYSRCDPVAAYSPPLPFSIRAHIYYFVARALQVFLSFHNNVLLSCLSAMAPKKDPPPLKVLRLARKAERELEEVGERMRDTHRVDAQAGM